MSFSKIIIKLFIFLNLIFFNNILLADIVKVIKINGNERISEKTIIMFSQVFENDQINNKDINDILKKLYETDYFENINIVFKNNILNITVKENAIIQNISYEGIKSNKLIEIFKKEELLKEKSPFNRNLLKNEKKRILFLSKQLGYYSSDIEIEVETLSENLVNINFIFDLGNKAKIKKINFLGNKIFKDSKLRRLITSSEYKFWKIISGKKYLNENLVEFDKRLLKNYYLNNGYYNATINTSFAKLIDKDEFELIFNIDAKNKIVFGDLKLDIPIDYNEENFKKIEKLFLEFKDKPYSINAIDKILKEIDEITALIEYRFIKASVEEDLIGDKINLNFIIEDSEKLYIEKINIFWNNVTEENVIRNQLEIDEGDPYNELLLNKSVNNLKSLNFFKNVDKEISDGNQYNTKVLNLTVSEKPTGEISASAGLGTSGGSVGFGVKENNFLGKGLSLDSNISVSSETFRGKFGITNPNFRNSDKSMFFNVEAIETDYFKTFGYKSNKTGFNLGTNFEYLDDLRLGIGSSNFYEKIETNSSASDRQQAQAGNYWDTFLNLDFNYDKRNQKFQTTSGFRSFYSLDIPIISKTNTLKNYYNFANYFKLFDKNISSVKFVFEAANSISNDDVKLSERVNISSSRLRGFESGRIGPKDGEDFIGGNFAYSLNFSTTIPQLLDQSQNLEFLFFIDTANVWGVDYQNSLDDSGSIRSSTGISLDWYSPIGPFNFSLAYPITKENGDKEETFRFNLGTTF